MAQMVYLLEYEFAQRALVTALVVGSVCSLLSVLVVLRRMAFIGQGVSHAAFGGVGTATLLGMAGLAQDGVVLLFCLLTALGIGALSRRRRVEADSAIGIVLAAAMAWGVLADNLNVSLQQAAWYVELVGPRGFRPSFESLLFGSLLNVSRGQMWMAVGVSLAVLAVLWWYRRELLFVAFDEPVSRATGVRSEGVNRLLLVLLAVTIVLSIRLSGVVLVTAWLILPGATAMLVSRRLGVVLGLSWLTGVAGVIGGVLLSLWGNLASGASIVAVQAGLFLLAWVFGARGGKRWKTPKPA